MQGLFDNKIGSMLSFLNNIMNPSYKHAWMILHNIIDIYNSVTWD